LVTAKDIEIVAKLSLMWKEDATMENEEAVRIDRASPDDAPGLVSTYEWLFAPPGSRPAGWEPDNAAEVLARVSASESSTVIVAREGERVVGVCTVYLDIESVRFGRRAWVEDLMVDSERRSRGVGKRLLDAAKNWARERGASHLELDSGEARVDAHRFYEREGAATRSISFHWEL
jgi:GNAT superfamily N-acetyltransferase